MNRIQSDLDYRRTKSIIDECTQESVYTISAYFTNIISFVLVMLLYYGLVIILIIALLIQLYDWNYNHEIFMDAYVKKTHEFRTQEEIDGQVEGEHDAHMGHLHWNMPLDFTNI